MNTRTVGMCSSLAVCAVCVSVTARMPDTVWVPVVYYDYQADGSNPNFEPSGWLDGPYAGVKPLMVYDTLPPDGKPLLLADRAFNDRLDEWFTPADRGNSATQFRHDAASGRWTWSDLEHFRGRVDEWVIPGFDSTYDMATVVIYDSLAFALVDTTTGTYALQDDTFFPLDGRGWGAQPATYPMYGWQNVDSLNYSFAMEMIVRFRYQPGLALDFTGDDDVWVFLDTDLILDLGGIKGAESRAISFDTLRLTEGVTYTLRFFYCERHVTGSHMSLSTNIVLPSLLQVDSLALQATPAVAQVPAGDSVTYEATVYVDSIDGSGLHYLIPRPDYGSLVNWSLSGDAQNPDLSALQGGTTVFYGQVPGTYTITASIMDPVAGTLVTNHRTVSVHSSAVRTRTGRQRTGAAQNLALFDLLGRPVPLGLGGKCGSGVYVRQTVIGAAVIRLVAPAGR